MLWGEARGYGGHTLAQEFNKLVSVTGASAQNLLTVLTANGFTGSSIGVELRYKAPALQSLFTGSSSTVDNNTGDELDAGAWSAERATGMMGDVIDPSQKYLYLASTASVGIFFRAK